MFAQLRARLNEWFDERFPLPKPLAGIMLTSDRLLLREMEAEDLPAVCAYLSDPEVLRHQERTTPYSEQEAWMMIFGARKQICRKPRDHYNLAVVSRANDQMVGECILTLLYSLEDGRPTGAATIGFMFQREYWNRGYATEAAAAMLRFAFVDLELESVYGGCMRDNIASRRVLEKLGMQYQLAEQNFPRSPNGAEAHVFSIERQTWLSRHK
jgi:[ribosomal protein S5]-alanine N-acetyltransferase